ncbi:MAG: helix-turn-helix transcriptional regulator [Candidatus Borkfalkiaceae bacterium]|nr:helix-turn-helix transcriptional regulator [Christensenellaceae bacterium]
MKTINDVVVERLCKYMGEQNLTQYKLAQLSGIPFPTIKSIMQRRTKGITLKTIIMLADGLNIKPSEFIDDPSFLAENLKLD